MPKIVSFGKPVTWGQTVLPDRSISIGQILVENGKIKKFKWDIFGDFQTLWNCPPIWFIGNRCFKNSALIELEKQRARIAHSSVSTGLEKHVISHFHSYPSILNTTCHNDWVSYCYATCFHNSGFALLNPCALLFLSFSMQCLKKSFW